MTAPASWRGPHRRAEAAASYQGVGTWIERRARVAGDHVAVVYGDVHLTYAELASRVRRLAHGLRSLGVRRGDRVAWLGPNHPAFLETLFATAKLGAVLAPINHRLERSLVDALCEDAAPQVMVRHASISEPGVLRAAATLVVDPLDEDARAYERLIARAADEPIGEAVASGDLCLLPFTSGTTGVPKGIMLTHANVTWNVIDGLSSLDFRGDDVTIAAVPFFRTGGTGVNVLPVLFKGGTVVIPRRTDPDEILLLLERHRATVGFGSPDLLEAFTRSPLWPAADLSNLRMFITGGAPAPERLLRSFHERRVNVLQGYGLSEAAPLVSVLDARNALRKIGSAGRPVHFVDTRIVRHDGTDARVDEIGELLVRGPNVMAGYWKRPDATRRAVDLQSWLRTGDAARADEQGFLFIVGRIADAYVSAGEVVHPGIVERVLLEHPAVTEVCVLGGDLGAIAYVVPAFGAGPELETELFSLVGRHFAPHERPHAIEFVDSLPRNPAGKILRHVLRQTFAPGTTEALPSVRRR